MHVSLGQITDIITMVGLIGGGLWAVWTFHKLQKARTAELNNNVIRTQLLSQQPQLTIELNVTETGFPTEICKSFLCITVTLKNEGEQNLRVDFNYSSLTIGRIVFKKNGGQSIEDVRRFGPSYFTSDSEKPKFYPYRIFRVGQKRQTVLAVLPVTEPGAHFVQFHAIYSKEPFDGENPDGENPSRKDTYRINANEQTVYFATGEPDKSTSNE